MSKTGNFLWRLFCALVVFFYHRPSDAEEIRYTKTICPKNQYVKSCSGYAVGTNWLKGGRFSADEKQGKKIPALTIPSYYEDLEEDATTEELSALHAEKIKALRYFFNQAGPDSILSTTGQTGIIKNITDADITKTDSENAEINRREGNGETLKDSEKIPYTVASDLLTLLCTSDVECAPCEGGLVDATTYEYDSFSILANTWKFYTIADCYKEDFSDTTGSFNYVDYENKTIQCKYNTDEETAILKGQKLISSYTPSSTSSYTPSSHYYDQ